MTGMTSSIESHHERSLQRLTPLPPQRAAELVGRYAAERAGTRRRVLIGLAVMAALVILAAVAAEVRPLVLVGNIDKFTAYIAQIVPVLRPAHLGGDLAEWYWGLPKWLSLLGETLLMAYLGTLLGALGGFVLCFVAAGNLVRSAALRFAAKRFLEICRTVPEIVFALIFVIAFGLGPMVGVLALPSTRRARSASCSPRWSRIST